MQARPALLASLLLDLALTFAPRCPLLLCSHLQRNPDNQLYPMFEYFENWCQVRCG